MIHCLSFKHKVPEDAIVLDVTSRSKTWTKAFSPFNLGPVDCYDGYWSHSIENAYQFSKIHGIHDNYGEGPNEAYWEWAQKGWQNPKPIKYPFGAWNKHLYHWWDGKKLSQLEAQNKIFVPIYAKTVVKTQAFKRLKEMYETTDRELVLQDFEGFSHRYLGLSWDQVLNDVDRPVGQGFVLCMILEGVL